jgi:hypothetical protein
MSRPYVDKFLGLLELRTRVLPISFVFKTVDEKTRMPREDLWNQWHRRYNIDPSV